MNELDDHLPTPWMLHEDNNISSLNDPEGRRCLLSVVDYHALSRADGEFIVKCVNAHGTFNTACHMAMSYLLEPIPNVEAAKRELLVALNQVGEK